jgi:Flp pilus assembly protein TadG
MDPDGELRARYMGMRLMKKNNKGIAVILMALMIFVLIGFVGFAIDIGYMYVAKGQLQNAADAAAVAGATLLDGTDTTPQLAARTEAVTFAAANKAAGTNVSLASNNTNTLSPVTAAGGNDITVGNWDPDAFPAEPYKAGRTPINAVQVRTRRTVSDLSSPQGQVRLFFSKVIGWGQMSASATAIATANRFVPAIVLCTSSGLCSMTGQQFYINNNDPSLVTESVAWSVFSSDPNVDANTINKYINGTLKITNDFCGQCITTTQGTGSPINNLAAAFANPNFDKKNKDITGSTVTAWRIRVPLVDYPCADPTKAACPPYTQGSGAGNEPYHVTGWAKINLTAVTAQGGANQKGFTGSVIQCAYCSDPTPPLTELGSNLAATLVK